ncbi:mechanosensitive ion channel family protein [Tepidanaerobacter sp. GT38]|uniref:mechanosensitive ion channel family protein n=1 Tax=Tepidanaerobacter sp. GT38 TaxID=2722793 RepID=UPI001F2E3D90|nr:mechanosensitive ion channel family protein [Tepidanaerobacter sp. GT38]MCG1011695.1 mechanosensitive ion channel family protein [Tepidanaerobacter sp. GT38]
MEDIVQAYNSVINQLPTSIIPLVKIVIVLIVSAFIIKIADRFVARIFFMGKSEYRNFDENKRKTLASLLKSMIRYVTYFMAALNILEIIGVNTSSLLAAAGVGGLAVGFGAQNLVKDVISGFFLIFEDQFNVGDYVEAAGVAGIVDEMGLRTTKIRDFGGQIHIIPNGEITLVTNHSRGMMRALVNINISYEEDLDKVLRALEDVCRKVREKRNDIVEGPTVLGISNLGPTEIVVSLMAKTVPMQQWSVEREIRKAVLEKFKDEGIEKPYPRMVYINRQSKGEEL